MGLYGLLHKAVVLLLSHCLHKNSCRWIFQRPTGSVPVAHVMANGVLRPARLGSGSLYLYRGAWGIQIYLALSIFPANATESHDPASSWCVSKQILQSACVCHQKRFPRKNRPASGRNGWSTPRPATIVVSHTPVYPPFLYGTTDPPRSDM